MAKDRQAWSARHSRAQKAMTSEEPGGTDGMERRRSLDGTLPGIGAEKKSRTGVPSAVARVAIFADWME